MNYLALFLASVSMLGVAWAFTLISRLADLVAESLDNQLEMHKEQERYFHHRMTKTEIEVDKHIYPEDYCAERGEGE